MNLRLLKWIDLPPIWLAIHMCAAWALAPYAPLASNAAWLTPVGTGSVALGAVLMLLAAWSMWRAKTTVIPHREPDNLVESGIFAVTRNPIYLGDALILLGLVLRAGAPFLLTLLIPFTCIIQRRFIEPEEARLRRRFDADFEAYCSTTRRWI